MKIATTALALGLAGFAVAAMAGTASAQQITGAGATFPAPVYGAWVEAAGPATGVKLNYQAIGSGGGINQIKNRTVDFGASDMPLKGDELAAAKLMQFPTVIGGVDIIVNLPNIKPNELKLTGPLLAEIYLGKITKWNDAKIAAVNPGVKLPNLAIASVHRADGSGTTFVFTDYLSKQSPDWAKDVGSATSVNWPGGQGAKGSDGVTASVKQIPGGIGYAESAYAMKNNLTTVMMKNKDGKFVAPTMESFAAAAANADWSKAENFAINLNDEPGAASWPIESATFVLLPLDPKDPNQSAAVKKFFDWGFSKGDEIATNLLYIPLPKKVQESIRTAWKAVPGGS